MDTLTVTDLRMRAAHKAVHDWKRLVRPVQPMFDEARALRPEIDRLESILANELPPAESWEYRRIERDTMALAARLVKLEDRIRHALPGLLEWLEVRSQTTSKGAEDGN